MEKSINNRPQLRLFGSPGLSDREGHRIALPARAFLLVVFVLTAGRGSQVTRSQLAGFLWPEAPNALTNLRQLLGRLRTLQLRIGINFVRFDKTRVVLNPDEVTIDFLGFDTALQGLNWATCRDVLEAYRGDLLEGMTFEESDISTWLAMQRKRVRNTLLQAFASLLEAPEGHANLRTAEAVAARLLEIDAYQESAYRALMRSFAASGLTDHVAATFEKCRALFERDLGRSPTGKTFDLFRKLVPGRSDSSAARPSVASNSLAGEALPTATLPKLVILPPPRSAGDETFWDIATLVLEDTIIGLCSLRTISLVAPHTSWQLSDGALHDDAARRFDIGYFLQTALRQRHGADELVVKLFDTRTRVILWADSYALAADSLAGSHRALSTAITRSLADAVECAEIARFEKDANPQAYYWHLIGQKHLRYMDLPNVRRALKAFRSSVAADPDFAPAYSGTARATQRQWLVLGRGDPDLLEAAEKIGAKAVSLDHRDARGYREIALCGLYRRHWDEAIANFSEAERLGPQHADLISDFGDALGHCGEPEKGLKKVERAMELNPIPPDQYWWNAAGLHFQLHDYQSAIAAVDKMSDPLPALRIAAASWAHLGDLAKARRCAAKFLRSYPDFRIEHWLSIVPNKSPDDHRHYDLGLRSAGFK